MTGVIPLDREYRLPPAEAAARAEHRREFDAQVSAAIARNEKRRRRWQVQQRSREDIDCQRDYDEERAHGWAVGE